jgi:DNA polymerase IIIc chi subunit
MKQTAVEWLFEQLWNSDKDKFVWHSLLEQAKELEKQQIIKAHGNKKKNARDTGNYEYTYTGEMYFNDNYFKK